ncbi:MAG TPA: NAD-glutamate dehydrogenase, partial [Pseudomonadales bacterium]|nr:NAD-glutamate dehydrogenase [Pseudomonadales bacterium]
LEVYRTWEDDLNIALNEVLGEEEAAAASAVYLHAFPASYKEDFFPRLAVSDIRHMEGLSDQSPMDLSIYRTVEDGDGYFRFKLFHLEKIIPLSDVVPVLENLGLKILGERPYEIKRKNNKVIWIHDFSVFSHVNKEISLEQIKNYFQSAFRQAWQGAIENDSFNRLVLGAQLSWQEVLVLRAYAKYLKQIVFPFSQTYIASTLENNPHITHHLINLFKLRFDPHPGKNRESAEEIQLKTLYAELDKVENLDEDRILRRYVEAIMATLRTNYFQWQQHAPDMPCISFKFDPSKIPDMPLPRPMFEIFVYSAKVEGVHLRAGKVARGGLRWSDRKEDYRTEVLGLVKAQQVKNSVIVPVGAKGGFVCKMLPVTEDREQISKEVIASYQLYVSSLLALTDNLKDGLVIPPENTVRKDGDDPYLVVAADKGTASFSDIANRISLDKKFWLGDAFASGGSAGYDHKKMAITARGGWVSVQNHFRALDINIQKQSFSAIGIGDMSGDVFGNGLLMSKKIKLLAAFNHADIFIDPMPNPEKSYAERERLFNLPRSSWQDYDRELISKGGGVFSRKAKAITITPEMQKALAIKEEKLTPNALISLLLKAPVDLIWNGGIGTYIKGSRELHSDVGDKSNDAVRINGNDVNCRVFCEGGNLGITQLGRIEMATKGVLVNADFIDNSAGVDCSDHEVNLKILLNDIVSNGDMTPKQRNQLLAEMTDEVAALVLRDNYNQVQALSFNEGLSASRLDELKRFIHYLENQGKLNRVLEFLPSDDEINERRKNNRGLTRPELAILMAYSKNLLKEQLLSFPLLNDPCVASYLENAFPKVIATKFGKQLYNHQLRNEILATQVANTLVNDMGFTFVLRMHDASGAEHGDIVKAYIIARSIYQLDDLLSDIHALDYKISAQIQQTMMADILRVVRRATRWFLRNRRGGFDVLQIIEHFQPRIQEISLALPDFIQGELKENHDSNLQKLLEEGVPETLAKKVAAITSMPSFLGVIEAADITHQPLNDVANLYFMIGNELDLHWFRSQIHALQINNHWQALARETYRDDLDWQQRALTVSVLHSEMPAGLSLQERLQHWKTCYKTLLERWSSMLNELKSSNTQEFSMYTVALRELLDIAQFSVHSCLNVPIENNEYDTH